MHRSFDIWLDTNCGPVGSVACCRNTSNSSWNSFDCSGVSQLSSPASDRFLVWSRAYSSSSRSLIEGFSFRYCAATSAAARWYLRHAALWPFQAAFWQTLSQYTTCLQPAHAFIVPPSALPHAPHARRSARVRPISGVNPSE